MKQTSKTVSPRPKPQPGQPSAAPQPDKSFAGFVHLLRTRLWLTELAVMGAAMLAVGIVMHILFPYPFMFPDSGTYVLSATDGSFNFFRPMGYSTYLSLLHAIWPSLGFVFACSLLLSTLSILLLLYSARYLLDLRPNWLFYLLCLFSLAAPRILFSANFLMSDGLFLWLAMLFATTALWLCYRRGWGLVVLHLLLLIALYKVRYAGMLLVPVSVLALWLSPGAGGPAAQAAPQRAFRWGRLALALLPLLCLAVLHSSAKKEYYLQSGTNIASGFSGWQLINNASVLVPEAREIAVRDFDEPEQRILHQYLSQCPDSLFTPRHVLTTSLMWDEGSPYKQFLFFMMSEAEVPYLNAWIRCSEIYGAYAGKLIGEYPGAYLTKFILPSLGSMFGFQKIYEWKNPFENEDMYRNYYGVTVDKYTHTRSFFSDIDPVRRIGNVLFWIGTGLALLSFFATTRRSSLRDKTWQITLLLAAFVVLYLGGSALGSPNTSWRYTMPVFIPALLLMAAEICRLRKSFAKRK